MLIEIGERLAGILRWALTLVAGHLLTRLLVFLLYEKILPSPWRKDEESHIV